MLTMYDSRACPDPVAAGGGERIYEKDIHPTELMNAIYSVMYNGYYYSAQTSSKLAGLFREPLDKSLSAKSHAFWMKKWHF
jgi:DNA-binding NarL/FixJ family response regulator